MSLDIAKLKHVKKQPGKTIAQCPACAEGGGDSKGNHLIIYPDGKYGCVATHGDSGHSKRIWELAGSSTWKEHPFECEVRPYQIPKRELIKRLARFANVKLGQSSQNQHTSVENEA